MAPSPTEHWNLGIGPISCHAWNKDKTQLAASASNNVIHIFEQKNGVWKEIHVLKDHDLLITGIDWAPNTNRIVSCSQDKNAFVWTFVNGLWKPDLVVVRSSRAATSVKWSPQENKFAVATGAKMVSICYYEKENDWWVSKHIKKPIRSTVTTLNWHPNNVLLALGACDFKARVFSAYIKEIDEKPAPNPWGTKMPFGALLTEYPALGWVHAVAFSPTGCKLAWVSHDSSISVVDKTDAFCSDQPIVCRTSCLPFKTLCWVGESSIIAAGHDCSPILFSLENKMLKIAWKLDVPPPESKNSNFNNAFSMFQNSDRTASVDKSNGVQLKTLHQNSISNVLELTKLRQVQTHTGRPDNITKFSTCGIDGLIAVWDLKETLDYCLVRECDNQIGCLV